MSQISLAGWNEFLEHHPNAHLLQMGEWGELKAGFGWKPVRFMLNNEVGAQILFRRLPLGLTLGYMPKPVDGGQWKVNDGEFWKAVDSICKKNHAIFLKVEPDAWTEEFHLRLSTFKPSPHNIQPPCTIIVSTKEDEEQILARMKPKCRYNIRLAEKKGVTVRKWEDIHAFHEMMAVTGGRDNFGVHSLEYYQRAYNLFHPKGTCELLVAEYEGKLLASLMVFANGNRAWYVYG
ncbi:MAG: peptidoglycan bridge formation glycyltransferase FemA/FemB family protein, partial [Anaerolineales bacterium]|nr:peptidoglycan bridge formation glycyltransferase FemA/FemB family protein [Anaerolineales bacterium]